MERLTNHEEQAMLAIWEQGECIISDVRAAMQQDMPYTTVASVVKNLEKKGYVTSRLVGNTRLYEPAVSQSEYQARSMSGVGTPYFSGWYKRLVTFFAEQEELQADDLGEILSKIWDTNAEGN